MTVTFHVMTFTFLTQLSRTLVTVTRGTWCVIEEVKSGDWAIGGQPLTTEAVQALARGDVSQPA
jgi:hypothetical protein